MPLKFLICFSAMKCDNMVINSFSSSRIETDRNWNWTRAMNGGELVNRVASTLSLFLSPSAAVLISGNCIAAVADASTLRVWIRHPSPRRGNNIASSVIYKPAIYRRQLPEEHNKTKRSRCGRTRGAAAMQIALVGCPVSRACKCIYDLPDSRVYSC